MSYLNFNFDARQTDLRLDFSLQVSTRIGNEVLVSSTNCGAMLEPDSLLDYSRDFHYYLSKRYTAAAAYAQQCYNKNSTAQMCSIYVQKELPTITSTNISCPFPGKEKICVRNSTNLQIDIVLNSHDHLGINTAPQNRFEYRRINECAPLNVDEYTHINTSEPYSSENASVEFLYGGIFDSGTLRDPATYRIPQSSVDYVKRNDADYRIGYPPLQT